MLRYTRYLMRPAELAPRQYAQSPFYRRTFDAASYFASYFRVADGADCLARISLFESMKPLPRETYHGLKFQKARRRYF